jgi:hypothetical protein
VRQHTQKQRLRSYPWIVNGPAPQGSFTLGVNDAEERHVVKSPSHRSPWGRENRARHWDSRSLSLTRSHCGRDDHHATRTGRVAIANSLAQNLPDQAGEVVGRLERRKERTFTHYRTYVGTGAIQGIDSSLDSSWCVRRYADTS